LRGGLSDDFADDIDWEPSLIGVEQIEVSEIGVFKYFETLFVMKL